MSKIINEAKIKNPLVVKIRELLEHRAIWLYLLTDEAEKRNPPYRPCLSAAGRGSVFSDFPESRRYKGGCHLVLDG